MNSVKAENTGESNRALSFHTTYDANGNLTQDASGRQFLYDAENHQREAKDAQNNTIGLYQYDGEGKRVKKVSSTETTVFVYNGADALVAEYSTQLATQQQVSYLTQDHLGSARVITNERGQITTRKDYMAFGDEAATAQRTSGLSYDTSETRKGYTGYEKDTESQLEFAQARYYNSTHGRFTSVDPLTASATIKNPQTFNRYSYVLNSPYKYTDPLGLISSSTGACGTWCQGSRDGGWGGSTMFDDSKAAVYVRQWSDEPEKPQLATQVQQIPDPPNITVICQANSQCSKETLDGAQVIINKLIAENWKIVYDATLTQVAKVRVPSSEVTEETETNSAEVSGGTSGAEVKAGNSTGIKSERLKSLAKKLEDNKNYINNNAIAVQALEKVGVSNPAELVAGVNQKLLDNADRILAPADQSPSLPGSLTIRRSNPNIIYRPAPLISPSERIRNLMREAHKDRSIWQD